MPSRSKSEPLWLELATVGAFCAFLFYWGLGAIGLVGADEPRYAQIAREMLARHDWVTPVLNGVAWLEKPVLYYWGAMVSYSVFGVSDWAARVPSAVLATAMVFTAYAFMRRLRPGSQLDAALILASLAAIIGFARAASTDMPLTATFTIAMLSWYAWFETRRSLWLYGAYIFLALGTLAKGPIAPFLAAIIVLPFLIIRRDWTPLRLTFSVPGLLLYFAVALPWYAMVQHRNPQFVRVFILEHNLERYSTNLFQHRQPFWYFIPVVLIAVLPWVVFAISALVRAIRESIQTRSSFELFFALWAIVPVVFFSFSESKLPGYILPAIPAFAMLTAEYLWRRVEEGNEPSLWLSALHALVGGGLLGSALLTVFFVYRIPISAEAAFYSIAAGVVIFAVMLVAIYAKGLRTARFVTLAPVVLALAFVIRWATPAIDAKNSERPVAQEISRHVSSGTPIAVDNVSRVVEYGLNFYLNRPIFSYQRGEVPAKQHLVVGRPAGAEAISAAANGRKVLDLGGFASQNLEFYMVTEK